jgi:ATP-dependent Clp protease adaptor protein ClpS
MRVCVVVTLLPLICLLRIRQVVPGMTVDMAVNIMNEAHVSGKAVVIQAPQEDAEDYCEQLRSNGLVSSIEPAGDKD